MIREYHNHKLQTNPWHREEEPHNLHETQGGGGGGLNAFYLYQIFALDSAVVEVKVDKPLVVFTYLETLSNDEYNNITYI